MEGEREALEAAIKNRPKLLSPYLSSLTDSLMCIGDKEIFSCKGINTFITTIWTQNCLLLSDDVCMKEIATTLFTEQLILKG